MWSTREGTAPVDFSDALHRRTFVFREPPYSRAQLLQWFKNLHPFYANRLESVTEWARIPPLGRRELKDIVPIQGVLGTLSTTTSGTSGHPVTVNYTREEYRFKHALMMRPLRLYPQLRDISEIRQLIILDVDYAKATPPKLDLNCGDRRFIRHLLSSSIPTEEQFAELERIRPQVLRGFPSAMVRLAEAVSPRRLRSLAVRVISPSGESLQPGWRELLLESFGCPVYDRYGATESGAIAWECPFCGSYHWNADELVLDESTEIGVCVTPLFLWSQPLLRYQLGDEVSLVTEGESCIVKLPKLTIRAARRDDWLIDGEGRHISPLSFQFEHFSGLRSWRIHQDRSGTILVAVDAYASDDEIRCHVQQVVPLRRVIGCRPGDLPPQRKFKRVSSSPFQKFCVILRQYEISEINL